MIAIKINPFYIGVAALFARIWMEWHYDETGPLTREVLELWHALKL